MKKLLLFIIFALQPVAAIHINEVMYNPIGDDNNREFIEVYLENAQSLDNWTIADAAANDTLRVVQYAEAHYALIVEEGYNITDSEVSYYSVGATIGNNLNNDADVVTLYDSQLQQVATMQYGGALANNNNRSLEFFSGAWYESITAGGTPGYENSISVYSIPNSTEVNDTPETPEPEINETENETVEINESQESPEVNDSNQPGHNETNTTPPELSNVSMPCNVSISITLTQQVFDDGEQVHYMIDLSDTSYDFTIEYWIEDVFGTIVKDKYNSSNTNQRSWTPQPESAVNAYLIKARIAEINCGDGAGGNAGEALIVVKGPQTQEETPQSPAGESSISIESVNLGTDAMAKFGDIIDARLRIYRGDTDKYAVQVYVEDSDGTKVSEVTKINAEEKYTEYLITVPVAIDSIGEDGTFTLVVEGLDVQDTAEITLAGSAHPCPTCEVCPEPITCPVVQPCASCPACPQCKECEKLLKELHKHRHIKSFYTLAKKYAKKINLYASVNSSRNSTVVLLAGAKEIEQPVIEAEKLTFQVEPRPGENTYLLTVRENDTIIDVQELTVRFDDIPLSNIGSDAAESLLPMQATGSAVSETVYESAGEKSKRILPYLFIPLLIMLGVLIIWKRDVIFGHNI